MMHVCSRTQNEEGHMSWCCYINVLDSVQYLSLFRGLILGLEMLIRGLAHL